MLPHALPVLSHAPSVLPRALPLLPRAPSMLAYAPLSATSFVRPRRRFLQVQARPLVQLEVDADPMAPYMALSAAHIRPSPLFFSFIPFAVYGILITRLTGSYYSVHLDTFCILAYLLYQFPFQ